MWLHFLKKKYIYFLDSSVLHNRTFVRSGTHPSSLLLLSLLLFDPRAAALGALEGGRICVAAAQRGLRWKCLQQLAGGGRDQDRQVGHRPAGPAARLSLHALHLPDRLHPGKFHPLLPSAAPCCTLAFLTSSKKTVSVSSLNRHGVSSFFSGSGRVDL